jgi:hypothetical protein
MDQALLVGINEYPYPNQLRGCINDVNDIEALLVAPPFGFAPGSITKLLNGDATADGIKAALNSTVGNLQAGDRLLFWYSGHGAQLVEGDPTTDVICPVDFNFTPDTSVTVDDFHNIFIKIPNGVIATWGSDSCHSGDLDRDFYRRGVPRQYDRDPATPKVSVVPSKFKGFRDMSKSLPNIVLISGCKSEQTSADACISERYNGAFTYYFLQTLRAGFQTPLSDLVPEVDSALNNSGYHQDPQLTGSPAAEACPFLQPAVLPKAPPARG